MSIPNYRSLEDINADLALKPDWELMWIGDEVVALIEEKTSHPDFIPRNSLSDKISWWYENFKAQVTKMLKK